jgi:hypothetical protein
MITLSAVMLLLATCKTGRSCSISTSRRPSLGMLPLLSQLPPSLALRWLDAHLPKLTLVVQRTVPSYVLRGILGCAPVFFSVSRFQHLCDFSPVSSTSSPILRHLWLTLCSHVFFASVLVFFGIDLDGVALLARLPSEKFASMLQIIHDWERRRCRQELESLIGTLHHFCQIIPPDRAFLRRMINFLCCFCNPAHPIRLNTEFHQDL